MSEEREEGLDLQEVVAKWLALGKALKLVEDDGEPEPPQRHRNGLVGNACGCGQSNCGAEPTATEVLIAVVDDMIGEVKINRNRATRLGDRQRVKYCDVYIDCLLDFRNRCTKA